MSFGLRFSAPRFSCALLLGVTVSFSAFAWDAPAAKPKPTTVVYPVADLMVPASSRPITVQLGEPVKMEQQFPKKAERAARNRLLRRLVKVIGSEPGTVEFRADEMALAVTRTPDVQKKVADYLAKLRREEDLSIALELRILRMPEQTVDRLGLSIDSSEGKTLDLAGLSRALEAVQGDRRTNILQAPKVTGSVKQPVHIQFKEQDIEGSVRVVPTVSADRRYVNLQVNLERNGKENKFSVVLPRQGTFVQPGWTTVRETRNEFGPPVLSQIPYINRLFKNVGIGRETEQVFLMLTPTIIEASDANDTE